MRLCINILICKTIEKVTTQLTQLDKIQLNSVITIIIKIYESKISKTSHVVNYKFLLII